MIAKISYGGAPKNMNKKEGKKVKKVATDAPAKPANNIESAPKTS